MGSKSNLLRTLSAISSSGVKSDILASFIPKWRRACIANSVISVGAMVFATPRARRQPGPAAHVPQSQRIRIGCRGRARLVDYLFHRDRPTFRPTLVRAAVWRAGERGLGHSAPHGHFSVKLRVSARFRKYRIWLNSMLSNMSPSRAARFRRGRRRGYCSCKGAADRGRSGYGETDLVAGLERRDTGGQCDAVRRAA